ncbi:MAG TPA: metallophosphoesterase [Thermoanaerobaculia bacterium]|nr:metallophosphoesterase [Thermoanaerobaculia bacterium]
MRRIGVIAVFASLFVYAGRPLLAAAAASGLTPAAAWSGLFGLAVLPLLPVFTTRKHPFPRRSAMHWVGYATLGVFSTLLVVVLLSDIVRGILLLTDAAVSHREISIGALLAAVALSIVGLVQARCPGVKRVAIPVDALPPSLDGYRIVQWSDVHVGPTIQRRFLESLVERTNALEPDAIAITGDLIDGYLADLREHVQPLGGLRARDGVFYVTGNHEYYWRASEWIPELQRLGLVFLKNEHRVIGNDLVIAGVTDPVGRYTHKQDAHKALKDAPADAFKILLSHRPQTARVAEKLGAHLQLSGHTHGGQFFPFSLFIRWFQPIVAGLHRVGSLWLYVSRGTGHWGPPSRLGVGGEITVITLQSAHDGKRAGGLSGLESDRRIGRRHDDRVV